MTARSNALLHTAPDELGQRLQNAADKAQSVDHMLAALCRLNPEEAAAWLAKAPNQARASLTAPQLGKHLDDIIQTAPAAAQDTLLQLALAFVDVLSPSSAAKLVRRTPAEEAYADTVLKELRKRAPQDPALLRLAAERAQQQGEPAKAQALLTELGRVDRGLATLSHIARQRKQWPAQDLPQVRTAFLSNYTIDPLLPFLEQEHAELGLNTQCYITPFNAWAQEVLSPRSGLYQFRPEIAFVALALDELIPELAGCPDAARLEQLADEALNRVTRIVTRLSQESNALIVVHGFFSAYADPLGIAEGSEWTRRSRWTQDLNARLTEQLKTLQRVHILDVQDALLRRQGGALESPKMRHYASMRLSEQSLAAVARLSAGYSAALKGLTRKCVVLDLDNTLWGGIVGEDGVDGIRLSNTSPGSEYRDFQQYLQTLTERGILLAINSKNNHDDALQALRDHEWMILRQNAFSAIRANWSPKPENMRELARELNIGLDAMIFIDDNPKERELMRQMLPEVLTPEMPVDPALYRQTLETLPQLQSLSVTAEDRQRVDLYRAQQQRKAHRTEAESLEDYLRSLDIRASITVATPAALPRIHQLFQRTNQFNLTSRRYSLETLRACIEARDSAVYALSASDRFGKHGLVAVALVRLKNSQWRIDSFLMSCRVIGYGIESALLAVIAKEARAAGAEQLLGEVVETAKNAPARDLYERHGFALQAAGDIALWARQADEDIASPAWITLEEEQR